MYVQDYANLIKFSLHSTTVTERGSQGAQKMLGIPGSHVVTSLNGNYLVNPTAIERKLWRLSRSTLNHIHLRLALFHFNYAQKTPYSLLTD